jgi:hypothetical protein
VRAPLMAKPFVRGHERRSLTSNPSGGKIFVVSSYKTTGSSACWVDMYFLLHYNIHFVSDATARGLLVSLSMNNREEAWYSRLAASVSSMSFMLLYYKIGRLNIPVFSIAYFQLPGSESRHGVFFNAPLLHGATDDLEAHVSMAFSAPWERS